MALAQGGGESDSAPRYTGQFVVGASFRLRHPPKTHLGQVSEVCRDVAEVSEVCRAP